MPAVETENKAILWNLLHEASMFLLLCFRNRWKNYVQRRPDSNFSIRRKEGDSHQTHSLPIWIDNRINK